MFVLSLNNQMLTLTRKNEDYKISIGYSGEIQWDFGPVVELFNSHVEKSKAKSL